MQKLLLLVISFFIFQAINAMQLDYQEIQKKLVRIQKKTREDINSPEGLALKFLTQKYLGLEADNADHENIAKEVLRSQDFLDTADNIKPEVYDFFDLIFIDQDYLIIDEL